MGLRRWLAVALVAAGVVAIVLTVATFAWQAAVITGGVLAVCAGLFGVNVD